MNRGFVTMAFGERYCRLAEHLYMSYKLFGECDYPFYVITDRASSERLGKTFDGVIVKDDFVRATVDKLKFFTDNPFDESVFIDSDCSIVNGIGRLFDEFGKNGSPVSAVAECKVLDNPEHGIQFGKNAIEKFGIKKDFPGFNGGVYYLKKCAEADKCISLMTDELAPKAKYYGFERGNNGINTDEPVVITAMLICGFTPVSQSKDIMYVSWDKPNVKWNMKNHTASFRWYENIVHPTVIHWTSGGTECADYENYDYMLYAKYHGKNVIFVIGKKAYVFVKYHIYPQLQKIFPFAPAVLRKIRGVQEKEFYE